MNYDSEITCPFCKQSVKDSQACNCQGTNDFYHETVRQAQACPNPSISLCENLVFQGGGILGVAYYGALTQIQSLQPDFLTSVKRVAGSSVGALVSLFVSMGMKLEDIGNIVSSDLSAHLDAVSGDLDTQVTIAAKPDFFQGPTTRYFLFFHISIIFGE